MTTHRFWARLRARHSRRMARRILSRATFYGSDPVLIYLWEV